MFAAGGDLGETNVPSLPRVHFLSKEQPRVDILRPFKYWPCCHRMCHFWVLSLEKGIVSYSFEKRQKVGEKEDTGVMGKDRMFSGRVHLVIQCPG